MNKNKSILEFIFGLVLASMAIVSLIKLDKPELSGLLCGLGGVALISSLINIRKYFFLSEEELKKMERKQEIENKDERNLFIKYKSAYITEKITRLIVSLYLIYLTFKMEELRIIGPIGIYLILGAIINRFLILRLEKEN